MIEKLFKPEIAAALWGFFIWHIGLAIIKHGIRPWLEQRAQDRQSKLEELENAQWTAQSLKTWAGENVVPEKRMQFLGLPIEDQLRIQKEIAADKERDCAEQRKLETKAREQAERDEMERRRREQDEQAQKNPEIQNRRAVDQFARGGW